jgi:hypothetical protein
LQALASKEEYERRETAAISGAHRNFGHSYTAREIDRHVRSRVERRPARFPPRLLRGAASCALAALTLFVAPHPGAANMVNKVLIGKG